MSLPPNTTRCPERPAGEEANLGITPIVGPLSLSENTPTTYVGPDVEQYGYTIIDDIGTQRRLEFGIAMLYVLDADGGVLSGPDGVEAIGITIDVPARGEVVAPFVWDSTDCRTQLPIEPGKYRAILDVGTQGLLLVDELTITP